VQVLLAHPDINVNAQVREGPTAFLFSCWKGHVAAANVLMRDPRVDITMPDDHTHTPLWYAAHWGHREVIEWLIASGSGLGDFDANGKCLMTLNRQPWPLPRGKE